MALYYPYEKFFFYLITSVLIFLTIGVVISSLIILGSKKEKTEKFIERVQHQRSRSQSKKSEKKMIKQSSDNFSEKVGQKIVNYMIEVTSSKERPLINDRVNKIRKECERLISLRLPEENKRIISNVLVWVKNFDVSRHINELKLFHYSSQIQYDNHNRDFKLMISHDRKH